MNLQFRLNNQISIPAIGLGTWQTPDGEAAARAVRCAVEAGYRHIDAASVYGNQRGVGRGIRESGIDRRELFVTSKVWNSDRGYDSTLRAFEKTLAELGLDYLDLYLIHWPATSSRYSNWRQINADTWRALEKLSMEGRVKAIGVSNFLPSHLMPLLQTASIPPAVNQIEYHPGYTQDECVQFCLKHGILIEGWSPLGTGRMLANAQLQSLAATYGKTVAQLCLQWAIQNGVLPLPKSVTPERIRENIAIGDFSLSEKDRQTINRMGDFGSSGLHPDTFEG